MDVGYRILISGSRFLDYHQILLLGKEE